MDPQLLARIQAMMGGQQPPTTPFSQPPGTTLNSNPAAATPQPMVQQAAQAGIQNPLTGNNMNMGGIGKGIQQLAGALSPQPAQMSQMQTPNLQPHQMNPQAMQLLMQQQQRPGSPGGGGPFGNTQGQGYA